MIDRRELLAKARERGLPLAMVEKDYVLGWALFGITRIPELVFKVGSRWVRCWGTPGTTTRASLGMARGYRVPFG